MQNENVRRVVHLKASIDAYSEFQDRMHLLSTEEGSNRFLEYVANRVPFYAHVARTHRETALHVQDFPLVSRADLERDGDSFVARGAETSSTMISETSAFTGCSIHVAYDSVAMYARVYGFWDRIFARHPNAAKRLRSRQLGVAKLYNRVSHFDDQVAGSKPAIVMPANELALIQAFKFSRNRTPTNQEEAAGISTDEEDRETVAVLRKHAPAIISTSTWHAVALAELDQEMGPADQRIQPAVLCLSSSPLYDNYRSFLAEHFCCPVLDVYGLTETGGVAEEEQPKGGLRVLPGMYVEVLREDGTLSDEGTGEFVVTSMLNWLTPLVRYRTGDWGTLERSERSDGTKGQTITDIAGRVGHHFFEHPDGDETQRFDPRELGAIMERGGAFHYQMRQCSPMIQHSHGSQRGQPCGAIHIDWVPPPDYGGHARDEFERRIRRDIWSRFGNLELHVRRVERLHAPGKMVRYTRESSAA